jgi:hypothetical protein
MLVFDFDGFLVERGEVVLEVWRGLEDVKLW